MIPHPLPFPNDSFLPVFYHSASSFGVLPMPGTVRQTGAPPARALAWVEETNSKEAVAGQGSEVWLSRGGPWWWSSVGAAGPERYPGRVMRVQRSQQEGQRPGGGNSVYRGRDTNDREDGAFGSCPGSCHLEHMCWQFVSVLFSRKDASLKEHSQLCLFCLLALIDVNCMRLR